MNKIFELHNYLDVKGKPEEIVEKIVEAIPESDEIGFAGYLEKKWLKMTLKRLILDKKGNNQPYSYYSDYEKEIKSICEEVFKKCEKYIDKKIYVFLFPTFDEFAVKNMNGVSGFCPWKNTLLIFINFNKEWKKYLKESLIHELAHALSPYIKLETPIGFWLVLEGLAENFKDFILPGNKSNWTKAISEKKSWEIFEQLKNNNWLESEDFEKYAEVFYGTGKYPLWAGYTIGYYLVKKYIHNQKNIDWNSLLRINPKKILEENDKH